MKKITLWVSGVLLAIGLAGSANALSFDRSYSVEKGHVANAMNAFNKMMRVDARDEHEPDARGSIGRILGALGSGNHRTEPRKDRSVLARAIARLGNLGSRNPFAEKHMAPVPEPEIYAMLIGGMFVVSRMARRRRKTS